MTVSHVDRVGAAPRPIAVDDVHLFVLREGRLAVDIHAWLDKLLGSALDDTDVQAFALARKGGRWLGIALGRNPGGQPRSGVFDMTADRVLFPVPSEVRSVARALRATAQTLTPSPPPKP
jgi:hypothetical protein